MENSQNKVYNRKALIRIIIKCKSLLEGNKKMDKRPIGIFDSGVGGITVLKEIKNKMPNENIIYIGDTQNFPYGNKSKEEITKFSIENVNKLLKKDVKIIVIACGTATSQAIDVLKEKFDIPIIGIIEPTVKYIKSKNYQKVGVIATEGTIKNGAWERKLKEQIPNIHVVNKACPMLATIAEEGKAKSKEGKKVIKEYMKPFKSEKIDKIILGCTHFPIYEQIIRDEFNFEIELINTGKTVSDELEKQLKKLNLENNDKNIGTIDIYLTKKEIQFYTITQNILKS